MDREVSFHFDLPIEENQIFLKGDKKELRREEIFHKDEDLDLELGRPILLGGK